MIGDPHTGVSEIQAGLDHRFDRLRAVTPRGVHLEVTAKRCPADAIVVRRVTDRCEHAELTEVVAAKQALGGHLALFAGSGDGSIDCRRASLLHELRNDAGAGRSDERYLPQRAGCDQIRHRDRKTDDRLRCTLVAEPRALGTL